MKKERLDILLVEKGYFPSREKAKSAIMAGVVFINNTREDKPGQKIDTDVLIEVKENPCPFVSRGGLKLEKAMKQYGFDLSEKVCVDVGASTGGFTDCMLKKGATKVYAIDVGYGQLAWELRTDPRVVCMERTNVRYVKPSQLDELVDFISIDVSFISLRKVINVVNEFLNENGSILCLIKPQFEAGREKVGKKGVVRDPNVHEDVINEVINFSIQHGLKIMGLTFSPIKGPEGNIEYLLYLKKEKVENQDLDFSKMINDIVKESHDELKNKKN